MQDYSYVRENLFERPATYEYARCESPEFLAGWERSRNAAILAWERQAEAAMAGQTEPRQARNSLETPLATVLQELAAAIAGERFSRDKAKVDMDLLVMKFEIFRRLFSAYGPDLRRASEAAPASLTDYILFAETLATFAERLRCAKYLSTLLKASDCLCSIDPSQLTPEAARRAALVLRREQALVSQYKVAVP